METHPLFPNRTNVQFMKILDRRNIRIEIWERGAGYTLASGSSGSAAAAVAHRLGLCDGAVTVHMPGGELDIKVSEDFSVLMTGPVTKVSEGSLSQEILPTQPLQKRGARFARDPHVCQRERGGRVRTDPQNPPAAKARGAAPPLALSVPMGDDAAAFRTQARPRNPCDL
jgi:hypothetical protein